MSELNVLVVGDAATGLLVDGGESVIVISQGEQGPAGRDGSTAAYLEQLFAADVLVTINHNFGKRPQVEVLSPGARQVVAGVTHVSVNQVQLDFASPQAGLAILTA